MNSETAYCVICAEDVDEGTVLPCGHANFHRQCLGRWFKENLSCPVCRGDMHEKLADLIGWDARACDLDRINSCLTAYAADMEEEWRSSVGDQFGSSYTLTEEEAELEDAMSGEVWSHFPIRSKVLEEALFAMQRGYLV